jgi:histidinol-phosphate aminotransferase
VGATGPAARPHRPIPLRADYADLRTYDPARVPCPIDLSDNTNLFGPSDVVHEAIARTVTAGLARYPAVYADRLCAAVAKASGVGVANVTTGCGSDDLIDSAFRAFASHGTSVAIPVPTFGMVPAFARMNGAGIHAVPLRSDLTLNVDAMLAARADITYLCRPNNPTGTLFHRADIERIVSQAAGVVLIDEAYVDFSGDDMAGLAAESDRAVVLRTFSKVHGLAGLRVAYALGAAPVVAEIEKSRGPYKVNAIAEAAAVAALESDRDGMRDRITQTRQNRDRLAAALHEAGYTPFPSAANFVLIPLGSACSAIETATALRARDIAVRPFPGLPVVGDCIRVTVGPWSMLERFLDAFRHVTATAGSRLPGAVSGAQRK